MRTTFINTLDKLAEKDERIICVIGDTGYSVFESFEKKYRERFINLGIAEQNFVGFSAGLAAMGMKPVIYNVASFMCYRAFEEIELDVSFQENPVIMVGVGGGHAYGAAGPTHHAYFDLALMSELPGITVMAPADPVEMEAALTSALGLNKPVYIRIGRSVDPIVHHTPLNFKIGKGIKMCEGEDTVILACGTMLKDAVKSVEILKSKGINASLYSMHTIKPIDRDLIIECAGRFSHIFTVEEHRRDGGLGTAVGNVILDEGLNVKLIRMGFPDQFAPVAGSRDYLNSLYGLSPQGIADKIIDTLS